MSTPKIKEEKCQRCANPLELSLRHTCIGEGVGQMGVSHSPKEEKGWEEEFVDIFGWGENQTRNGLRGLDKVQFERVKSFIQENFIARGELKSRVGFLRQWLNEDRITDPNKMITSREVLTFLCHQDNKE